MSEDSLEERIEARRERLDGVTFAVDLDGMLSEYERLEEILLARAERLLERVDGDVGSGTPATEGESRAAALVHVADALEELSREAVEEADPTVGIDDEAREAVLDLADRRDDEGAREAEVLRGIEVALERLRD